MTNFRIDARGALADGAGWSSRLYVTGNIAEATAATAAHTGWDALWGAITTYLPAATTLTLTGAFTLTSSWKNQSGTETTETLAGTSTSESMPVNTAPVITWRTADRGRGKTGRSFMPAFATNSIDTSDTGKLLTAAQTALKTGATDLVSALTGAGLTLVVLDRTTLTSYPITAPQVANLFRTQRRRQRKITAAYA